MGMWGVVSRYREKPVSGTMQENGFGVICGGRFQEPMPPLDNPVKQMRLVSTEY